MVTGLLSSILVVMVIGFSALWYRLGRLEGRMNSLEWRMSSLEERITGLEGRMTGIESRLNHLGGGWLELGSV
ncbi:hypothetical protein M1N59_00015 [Dehalococcoidales bacterium]|nr:hypothetical protein [Dehalococcoidales bacterium]